jgi:hypothetical protein
LISFDNYVTPIKELSILSVFRVTTLPALAFILARERITNEGYCVPYFKEFREQQLREFDLALANEFALPGANAGDDGPASRNHGHCLSDCCNLNHGIPFDG